MVSAKNIFFILPKTNKHHHKNNPSQNQRQTEQRSLIMVSSFQTLAQTLHSLVHSRSTFKWTETKYETLEKLTFHHASCNFKIQTFSVLIG